MNKNEAIYFLKSNKNFFYLWISQILSQVTINIMNFVMATRIYEATGSTLAVSFLWVFYFLPSLFLGPFSGFFVDIWPLRKTLFITNLLQTGVMFLFLFIGNHIYPIYPLVFLYSLFNQFYFPAEAAALPWLVKRKDLSLANSLFMITVQGSLIFGLGSSGILMRLFGRDNPIFLSGLFLLMAAIAVYFLPKNQRVTKIANIDISRFLTQIKIGYSFIQGNRIVLFPMLMVTFFQIMLLTLAVSLPSFASQVLKISIPDAGPLLVVPLGVGALVGTYFIGKLKEKFRKKDLIKRGMIGTFIVFMLVSLVLPFLNGFKLPFSIIMMFLLGLSIFLVFVPNQTLIQEKTPSVLRGRVYGAWNFLTTTATLPYLLFSATIIDFLGFGLFVFLAGLIIFSLIIAFDKFEKMVLIGKDVNTNTNI